MTPYIEIDCSGKPIKGVGKYTILSDDRVSQMPDKVTRHKDLCLNLNDIYAKKNADYGDSFHDTFEEEGMAMARIRLSDKLNRFKNLTRNRSEQKVNDESIKDTLLDLANYALMTILEVDEHD